jgi:tagaturonate reductase
MQLSKENLLQVNRNVKEIPAASLFELPEKVLQFGTGVLLRGLPDYFIDKANKQGIFNGRVVIVKSTDSDSSAFDKQNGLYTVCVRGVENGNTVQENIINASVSRVLSAKSEWQQILDCASNPQMKIVLSNTTEVGIQLTNDDVNAAPPSSFPGKLLAFLVARYKAFNGSAESGLVIVPTELITDNGDKLKEIVFELAKQNNLDTAFVSWLSNYNSFCNSLVDRIVPGKPDAAQLKKIEEELGYTDDLLTMSEVFRLWAIQGDNKVKEVLSFAAVDNAVIIAPDITLFKELKLRLLNGTHTFNCGTAFLSGFNITRDAVNDKVYGTFTKNLMHKEIAAAIPYTIDEKVKADFANSTFERFCNPFIDHQWQSITVQYTSKMKMRNMPLLEQHYKLSSEVPQHMATGFAAFLLYMKITRKEARPDDLVGRGGKYFGERDGVEYEIKDDSAEYFYNAWQQRTAAEVAELVTNDTALWGLSLASLPGFLSFVQQQLNSMQQNGVLLTVNNIIAQAEPVI